MRQIIVVVLFLILATLLVIVNLIVQAYGLGDQFGTIIITSIIVLLADQLIRDELSDWLLGLSQFIQRRIEKRDSGRQSSGSENTTPLIESELLTRLEQVAPPRGAELIVISSGKGGVGKSLLALGIVEHLSKRGSVLLVDFDLQNRGLTSLLDKGGSDAGPSIFALLDQFRNMLKKGTGSDTPLTVFGEVLNASLELPKSFDVKHFRTMTEKFARARDNEIWENLQQVEMMPINLNNYSKNNKEIRIVDDSVPLYPPNAFFLPSRLKSNGPKDGLSEDFLFTDTSTSSFIAVYLFLRSLSWWLGAPTQGKKSVKSIVLDCHGAHDMFTVGSILAAQKLIIVTTTDPGSWDGTGELLRRVQEIQTGSNTRKDIVLVFNNMRHWDEVPPDLEDIFGIKGLQPPIVTIAEDKRIRNLMKQYEFGDIAKHRQLWRSVRDIFKTDRKTPNKRSKTKLMRDSGTSQPMPEEPRDETLKEPNEPIGTNSDHKSVAPETIADNAQVSDAKEKH
jgi:ATPases involved in chromosome partitioning